MITYFGQVPAGSADPGGGVAGGSSLLRPNTTQHQVGNQLTLVQKQNECLMCLICHIIFNSWAPTIRNNADPQNSVQHTFLKFIWIFVDKLFMH
jgi:hypothetical protein